MNGGEGDPPATDLPVVSDSAPGHFTLLHFDLFALRGRPPPLPPVHGSLTNAPSPLVKLLQCEHKSALNNAPATRNVATYLQKSSRVTTFMARTGGWSPIILALKTATKGKKAQTLIQSDSVKEF